ncbi:unnamed protein product [Amoebophrya sp. A120]|nr:unnamed protein product [Amoebophrya sp. A120]|eukprot:GSA120T00000199001.1
MSTAGTALLLLPEDQHRRSALSADAVVLKTPTASPGSNILTYEHNLQQLPGDELQVLGFNEGEAATALDAHKNLPSTSTRTAIPTSLPPSEEVLPPPREHSVAASNIIPRQGTAGSLSPTGWRGPRGNFVPAGAMDPFLNVPQCEETLFTTTPGLINLDTGAPDVRILNQATRMMAQASAELLADLDAFDSASTTFAATSCSTTTSSCSKILKGPATCLQYGPTVGTLSYRKELAKFLNEQFVVRTPTTGKISNSAVEENTTVTINEKVDPSELFETNGATGGLLTAISAFFPPAQEAREVVLHGGPDSSTSGARDVEQATTSTGARRRLCFIEDPSYFLAPKMLTEQGFELVPIPMEEDGLDVFWLEKMVEKHLSAVVTKNCSATTTTTTSNTKTAPTSATTLRPPVVGDGPKSKSSTPMEDESSATSSGKISSPPIIPASPTHFAAMVYCIPSFHNPTGCVLSAEKREKLLFLARKWNLLIFCDDVYELLNNNRRNHNISGADVPVLVDTSCVAVQDESRSPKEGSGSCRDHGGPAAQTPETTGLTEDTSVHPDPASTAFRAPVVPPRLVAYDYIASTDGKNQYCLTRGANVISNNTFSKILGPGVRCGWIEAGLSLIEKLSRTKATCSAGAAAQFVSSLVERNLRSGRQGRFLDVVRDEFEKRRNIVYTVFYRAMAQALRVPGRGVSELLNIDAHRSVSAVVEDDLLADISSNDRRGEVIGVVRGKQDHSVAAVAHTSSAGGAKNVLPVLDEASLSSIPVSPSLERQISLSLDRSISFQAPDPLARLHAEWEQVKGEMMMEEQEENPTETKKSGVEKEKFTPPDRRGPPFSGTTAAIACYQNNHQTEDGKDDEKRNSVFEQMPGDSLNSKSEEEEQFAPFEDQEVDHFQLERSPPTNWSTTSGGAVSTGTESASQSVASSGRSGATAFANRPVVEESAISKSGSSTTRTMDAGCKTIIKKTTSMLGTTTTTRTTTRSSSATDRALVESHGFRLKGGTLGGMCVFLECKENLDAHQLLVKSRCVGVSFKPGDLFSVSGTSGRNCLRIAVAHYGCEELAKAMWLLAQMLVDEEFLQ